MKKISLLVLFLMIIAFTYATQLEVVGEVFSSYSG
jgi:hypothetical protein